MSEEQPPLEQRLEQWLKTADKINTHLQGLLSELKTTPHQPKDGDVYQINEKHGRAGWIGALVIVTEVKSFGIQGYVHHVTTHDTQSHAYIRLPFDHVDFIGTARLMRGRIEDHTSETESPQA